MKNNIYTSIRNRLSKISILTLAALSAISISMMTMGTDHAGVSGSAFINTEACLSIAE